MSFTWEVRKLLDSLRPGLILHGYCHPSWANRFSLQYLSSAASAHGDQPGRGESGRSIRCGRRRRAT